ncbi:MGDG synthase family glycosyltransferase [Cohnella lupini]|uniref:Processive 1,2-diacylglycerol beta-glucosyltransferase n=1 Tax=Cohnella lupini TaxID=1294267 RepID=A0A3D9ISP1_9BACL|nr:glycosyltransferase [Cohnella lupini]RED64695.1 processive 1,2-diacylglycerol beta-glucosyltransferase [Cohnella lupini]
MSEKRKIFILYARFGEGHWQAASALRDSFIRRGNTEVKLIDLLAESNPVLNSVSRYVYNKSYSVLPQLYGWVYDATKSMKSDSLFASWLHSFGALTLQKLVEKERPDAIVHTFPILVLPLVNYRTGRKIPMYNVVTDFDLHLRWVHPDVDKYYVATEDISKQLCELGVHPKRVSATGIPIRPSFMSGSREASVAYGHHLSPDKPVVLVMAAASTAWADTAELCRKLAARCHVQVLVVCGRSLSLRSFLSAELKTESNATVLGYVEYMDDLMAISSCIVTKPGGLTLSEAIIAELPIVLYRPVPGQERNNARYLESKGAAVVCQTTERLLLAVSELLQVPGRRKEMKKALRALGKRGASDSIALDIDRQLHIMEEASSVSALV